MTELAYFDQIDQNWVSDLPRFQRESIEALLVEQGSYDRVVDVFLAAPALDNNAPYGGEQFKKNLGSAFEAEFCKFICGDPSYEDLRKQTNSLWESGRLPIITAIASGIGATLGIAAAVFVPAVALMLSIVAKIGIEAWCNTNKNTG